MMLHVRHAKGGKDRLVPWLFPSEGKAHINLNESTEPMHNSSVQDAFVPRSKKAASISALQFIRFATMPSSGVPSSKSDEHYLIDRGLNPGALQE